MTEYWSAVAQVSPVLALALVLEARAFAHRVHSRKRFAASRNERAAFVSSAGAAAVGLTLSFIFAMGALLSRSDSSHRTPWDIITLGIALIALPYAFSVVVAIPLLELNRALRADVRANDKTSRLVSRLHRKIEKSEAGLNTADRELRAERLNSLIELSSDYVQLSRLEEALRNSSNPMSASERRAAFTQTGQSFERLETRRTVLTELREWVDSEIAQARATVNEGRDLLAPIPEDKFEVYRKRLASLVD
ncbi:hypothetical protein [Microbacterium sp.]|uniref:hypothetical protein n=1 Tax=Microbacterium sp. TaxID=51671 RepID=UPI003A8D6CF2